VDQIKTQLDQLAELGDEQVAELQQQIISTFESVETEQPTPETVDAMTFTQESKAEIFMHLRKLMEEGKIKIPNKSEYNYGLECMKNVKEKTNIFNQFELYNDLFTI
jgi:hypothetical protein